MLGSSSSAPPKCKDLSCVRVASSCSAAGCRMWKETRPQSSNREGWSGLYRVMMCRKSLRLHSYGESIMSKRQHASIAAAHQATMFA